MMSLAPDLHASTTNTTSHRFTSTRSFTVIDLFNLNVLDFTITSTQMCLSWLELELSPLK